MAANLFKVGTSNAFSTTLNGTITDSANAVTLTTVSGLQYPGVIVLDRVDSNGTATPVAREYISFTGITGSQLTGVVRGLGGSSAQAHNSGAVVEECFSVDHWNDLIDSVLNILTPAGALDTTKIVSPTGIETLTNKTLTAPVLGGSVTGTYTLAGTPTITSPTIATPSVSGTISGEHSLLDTAAPAADVTASGLIITLTAAGNVGFGDVCYIASTGKATIVDADAIASSSGIVMALGTISADAAGSFLLHGIARNDAWNWTVGGLIYITVTATTGNTLSQTAPSGTDDVIQIVGVATHADRMFFNPQLVQIEHT